MTLEDLEQIRREYLTPAEVAKVLGVNPYRINLQVKKDKREGTNSFPFPTILIGTRVKIPRQAFLEAMRHGS